MPLLRAIITANRKEGYGRGTIRGYILAGHTRLKAAQLLGLTEVPVIVAYSRAVLDTVQLGFAIWGLVAWDEGKHGRVSGDIRHSEKSTADDTAA